MWDGRRSRTSNQLRDEWSRYVRGWWGYYRLAEARNPVLALEKWVRRHIRKRFWLRCHGGLGRLRRLRRLGVVGRVAAQPELHAALSKSVLRRHGFLMPSDL